MESSGIFLAVKRDGRHEVLDIVDLTDAEVEAAMEGRQKGELVRWIVVLVKLLRRGLRGAEQ